MRFLSALRRRPSFAVILLGIIWGLATQDAVASVIVATGLVLLAVLISNRSKSRTRTVLATFLILSTLIAGGAALGVPTYKNAADELYLPKLKTSNTAVQKTGLDLTGYVVSDNDNAINGVDSASQTVTHLAATGAYIASDGTFAYLGVQNALLHAHLGGARAQLVLQNFNLASTNPNADFSPVLAHRMLVSAASRAAYIKALMQVLNTEHWDGVVVDFEVVAAADQPNFSRFLDELHKTLAGKLRLTVAVPVPDVNYPPSMVYDLSHIGKIADAVNVMTYNKSDPSGAAGPIAPLDWVKSTIQQLESVIPKNKIQLGISGYGYVWGPGVKTYTNTIWPKQARAIVAKTKSKAIWDATAAEWHATLPDGTVMWWDDARSYEARVQLAQQLGIEGAAIWEVSQADPLTSKVPGVTIARVAPNATPGRSIDFVNATGLVALTFDDGPDPTWTPKILAVLHKYKVPATFFVVGQMAQRYHSIISNEVASGSIVANHTYTHLDLNTVPRWRALTEINLDSWVIHGITGRTPKLFRSPYGSQELSDTNSNAHRNLAKSLGLEPVGWNVETSDWARPGVATIVRRATQNIPHEATILMHDGGGNRQQTVQALNILIPKLLKEGYVFTTVDHLDASLTQPYESVPTTFWGVTASVASIASYRLWIAFMDVFNWILAALAILSLIRLALNWIFALRYQRTLKATRLANPNAPMGTVAVVIPAHNEALTIVKTLSSMTSLWTKPDTIIVAENGSKDATAERAREFAAQHPELNIKVREYGPVGKAGALNAALAETDCEFIVVLDADTVIHEAFLDAAIPFFADPTVGAVAGNVRVGNTKKVLAKLQALEYGVSLALDRSAQAELGVVSVVPGAAGAFRKTAVEGVGGWPGRTLVEDTDLTVLLHQAGWKIPYEPLAISFTEAPESSGEVIKQRKRWAFGSIEVVAIYANKIFHRRSGRLGMLGLPWLLLSQVILPAAGPIVDLYLIWLLLEGYPLQAIGMLVLGIAGESISAGWALRKSDMPMRWLWLLPLSRIWWRTLLLISATSSVRSWLQGRSLAWSKLKRKNSVQVSS